MNLTGALVIIFVAVMIGGAAYHGITVRAYKGQISILQAELETEKQKTVSEFNEKTTLAAANEALKLSNQEIVSQVNAANESLKVVLKEREVSAQRYRDAVATAKKVAQASQTEVDWIKLQHAEAGHACEAAQQLLRSYVQRRGGTSAPPDTPTIRPIAPNGVPQPTH